MIQVNDEKDRQIIEEQAAILDTIHEMLGSGKWTMDFDKTGMMTQVKWSRMYCLKHWRDFYTIKRSSFAEKVDILL